LSVLKVNVTLCVRSVAAMRDLLNFAVS